MTLRAGSPRRMERVVCFRDSRGDLADVLVAWVSHHHSMAPTSSAPPTMVSATHQPSQSPPPPPTCNPSFLGSSFVCWFKQDGASLVA